MYNDSIVFQLATHFLPKIALRLEYLYQTINEACEEQHPIIHHYALKNVIEIIALIDKPELKSRFLKEFMRIEHSLDKPKLQNQNIAEKLHHQIQDLSKMVGRFGENIHTSSFLQSVRQSQPGLGNECEANIPQLVLWLESNSAIRQRDLVLWLNNLRFLYDTVSLYLSILRESAEFHTIHLKNGFYQSALPPKTACHLIMLRMEKSAGIIPQMQLGHHGLILRLSDASTLKEIHNTDAKIDLSLCQL